MKLLIQFTMYAFIGSILLICSTTLIITLVGKKALRAKYAILLSQFFTYAICGLSSLTAGVGRLIITASGDLTLRSKRYCLLMPWNIFFMWSDPMSAVVLLLASIDRLIAVSMPITYYKNSCSLQLLLISTSHGFMILSMIVGWATAFVDNEPLYSPVCWNAESLQPQYVTYMASLRTVFATSSVVLYFIVFVIARRKWNTNRSNYGSLALTVFAKRQQRLTVTMCISCAFTVVFYVVPTIIEQTALVWANKQMTALITTYSLISTYTNPIVIMGCLVKRHEDVQDALKERLLRSENMITTIQRNTTLDR